MRFATLLVCAFFSLIAYSDTDGFFYPEQFSGTQVRANYDSSNYGYATNNGYVSVFNLDRKVVESFLPPQFGLAEVASNQNVDPVIVVWGEMSQTGAYMNRYDMPYGLTYREMHFFIPGVYLKNGDPHKLRSYTPRMFVDASEPYYLGLRFYYKKILLNSIKFNIESGMETEDWVSAKVLASGVPTSVQTFKDKKWLAALAYLPQTDIMADDSQDPLPRCSGWEWLFDKSSTIAPVDVSLKIHKKLVDGMSPDIIDHDLRSVASFRVENWQFLVDYYYNSEHRRASHTL